MRNYLECGLKVQRFTGIKRFLEEAFVGRIIKVWEECYSLQGECQNAYKEPKEQAQFPKILRKKVRIGGKVGGTGWVSSIKRLGKTIMGKFCFTGASTLPLIHRFRV